MNNEITIRELKSLPENSYMLIDIRDEYAFSYGHIDDAVNIPQKILNNNHTELPKDKKLIICCKSGIISRETAEMFCENGL
ncbi:MAG: rhodanese-like domain-containing protein [Clostridium sp.]|nr:rhodanese-like domain-containing protein [Clostridium sp.]